MAEKINDLISRLRTVASSPDSATDQRRSGLTVFDGVGRLIKPMSHPVLTASQIGLAEESLGVRLPLALRRIYMDVGNGGFGPGYGLLPLLPLPSNFGFCDSVVELGKEWRIILRSKEYEGLTGTLLPVSEWGDGEFSCVIIDDTYDSDDLPILRIQLGMEESYTRSLLRGDNEYLGPGLLPEGMSLVTWLGAWLEGKNVKVAPYVRKRV